MNYPYHMQQNPMLHQNQLKNQTLAMVEPWVKYGLNEAKNTSYMHAMTEIAAVSYLMGMGYPPKTAYQLVESWEVNEKFY